MPFIFISTHQEMVLQSMEYRQYNGETYPDHVEAFGRLQNEMNGVSGHDSAPVRLYWAGTTWANEMNLL